MELSSTQPSSGSSLLALLRFLQLILKWLMNHKKRCMMCVYEKKLWLILECIGKLLHSHFYIYWALQHWGVETFELKTDYFQHIYLIWYFSKNAQSILSEVCFQHTEVQNIRWRLESRNHFLKKTPSLLSSHNHKIRHKTNRLWECFHSGQGYKG